MKNCAKQEEITTMDTLAEQWSISLDSPICHHIRNNPNKFYEGNGGIVVDQIHKWFNENEIKAIEDFRDDMYILASTTAKWDQIFEEAESKIRTALFGKTVYLTGIPGVHESKIKKFKSKFQHWDTINGTETLIRYIPTVTHTERAAIRIDVLIAWMEMLIQIATANPIEWDRYFTDRKHDSKRTIKSPALLGTIVEMHEKALTLIE